MSQAAVQHHQPPPNTQQYPSTSVRYTATSSTPPNSRRVAGNASPNNDHFLPPNMTSPRGSSLAAQTSPAPPVSSSAFPDYYTEQKPSAALPIRTAVPSTPKATNTTSSSYDGRGYSTRAQGGYGSESDRERASDGEYRSGHRAAREDSQPGSGKSHRTRNTPATSRSTNAVGQPPMGTDLPRENSTVIQRIVVDDPQADLAREELRQAEGRPHAPGAQVAPIPGIDGLPNHIATSPPTGQRSRQEHLKHQTPHRKEVKFGDYILGQTLGEGEFGKVKMGWKKDSPVQVAIKLIRKESLAGNNTRLPKIYREIAILRELQHPNIVRLHEFVETERHMGIILEYASGGELFDFILNQRYLKDPAARRLFAQLVSGVGYLHQKGIVHRDLKLENLLLDRNKHIIITDFGFANTFDPNDELGEEVEARINDKDFVKRENLDKVIPWRDSREGGHRRGDLMNTSCGSPCYAAPELVVSDGLYTGRKVDVWSCGVILYAMLAGYLPFDDDPANPEGDNINLLYKYIVSTPLTFPDYVTPHARDLLRRILVPDPRRRADLFEVARHSWLSEYTHVVGFIGSKVKSEKDMVEAALQNNEDAQLGRSASVREPPVKPIPAEKTPTSRTRHATAASIGGEQLADVNKQQRDVKRNTLQLEYVPPNRTTSRTDPNPPTPSSQKAPYSPITGANSARTRSKIESGPVEVPVSQQRPANIDTTMPPPASRPGRDQQRAISDSTGAFGKAPATPSSRPNTGGTLGGAARLPSRGNSYSQPVAAQPTNTTAQGSISQPKSSSPYNFSTPMQTDPAALESNAVKRPMSQQNRAPGSSQSQQHVPPVTKHRRTGTWGSITDRMLNRSNSRRSSTAESTPVQQSEKRDRRYPPVSLRNAIPQNEPESTPRASMESRRTSFGFTRKASRERDSSVQGRRSRRFSFLPSNFSFTGKKEAENDDGYEDRRQQQDAYQPAPAPRIGRPQSKGMPFGRGTSRSPSGATNNSTIPLYYDADREAARAQRRSQQSASRFPAPPGAVQQSTTRAPVHRKPLRDDGYGGNTLDARDPYYPQAQANDPTSSDVRHDQYDNLDAEQQYDDEQETGSQGIRPQQRRFGDAYDHGHGGSSSATRRVMDFFRRRGKDRTDI